MKENNIEENKNKESGTEESRREEGGNGERKNSYLPTKLSLFIRIAVGGYLLYIVYTLRDVTQKYTGKELLFFLVAIALFGILGIFLCIHSIRGFIKGRYEGGAMDSGSDVDERDS